MNNNDDKIIELSKTKVWLLVAGAFVFVALGIWMFQLDAGWIAAQRRFNNPLLVHGVGAASVVFFGLCAVLAIKRLFASGPGLVFSSAGIFDNSSDISLGFIPWSDIVGFDVFDIQKQRVLIVKLADPEKYVDMGGYMKRALNRANLKMYGSPIAITSNALKIDFNELVNVCNLYLAKYRKSA